MKEFEVTITETLQKAVTVEAATREEAQAMVEEMWDKGDVVLDADNFVGADFACDNGHEIEENKSIEVLLVEPGQYANHCKGHGSDCGCPARLILKVEFHTTNGGDDSCRRRLRTEQLR